METEEIIKLVDGIYKNILEKFNPGARQLISAGKAYLKALHGASAASNLFNEALAKIAVNAQQGGTIDIGSALMNIVGVYKEIQDQHMNILKAFYVDLLVPLETNLEKDTKVVQFEQKKFLQQHKLRSDGYSKAATTMKKYRKKNSKSSAKDAEKEIKSIQTFEEEKHKLDQFCEYSLKNAMTQERRRYGFVLERQCSLAKHWMAYHHSGHLIIEKSLENWNDVAATREFLPPNVENMFITKQLKDMEDDDDDAQSIASQLRKTRSIDASCLDMRSLGDVVNSSMMQMPRAKSEFNLNNSSATSVSTLVGVGVPGGHMMSATLKSSDTSQWERPTVKALYAYLSSGENQLSFLEGDRIALVGDRAKGWQFGENLRTQKFGWFPIAYAENERDNDKESISEWVKAPPSEIEVDNTPDSSLESTLVDDNMSKSANSYPPEEVSPTRMFGDTIQYRQSKQFRRLSRGEKPPKPGPPPQLPAPVPTPVVPNYSKPQGIPQSNSFSSSGGAPMVEKRKTPSATINFNKPQSASKPSKASRNGIASASLHSSNDSGFSNEPQPQPEVEMYSDEETVNRVPIRSSRSEKNLSSPRSNERDLSDHRYRYNSRGGGGGDPSMMPDDDDDIYGTIVPPRRQHMRQANSFGNIADSNAGTLEYGYRSRTRMSEGHPNGGPNQSDSQKIKRTKSFWKFSKSQDHILEGMAMWKHNDIIPTGREKREMEKKEATLKRNMRKKEQIEKQKQKEMIAVKEAEEAAARKKEQQMRQMGAMESGTLMRNRERERERDHDRAEREHRERPHSIAMMPEQEKFPITKSDIDKRISKLDEMQQQQQQKKVSQPRQERQERMERQDRQDRHERQDRQERQERHERQDRQDRAERMDRHDRQDRQDRHERDRRHEESDRKPSKSSKQQQQQQQDSNNNRNSYVNRLEQEEQIYGESMQQQVKGKDKYRTSERESSKNRNNDALNKYYQDQHFDDFAIIPSDSIMIQDTSFYDDDGMMDDDMMLMKTVRRKEILKQYYSSGTDTERNSSSSDAYDCIVVDDHLVSAADMMMRKNRGDKSRSEARKSNGESSNNRMENTPKQEEKMTFSTFRGTAVDDDEAMMMLEDEMMDEPPRDTRRSKLSKANSTGAMHMDKYESEQESRISAKVTNNGNQKRKSTKSTASDGKAYGPWYDLWGAEGSTMQSQK
ncbi:zinc finger CCCH domain-containing protein 13 [Culex pipiens pallens]|uniref:zinc finger CCCH domain-containing protein 13 n=1 Tax=Culex pipiens pallens TaxID=42434 RepID=UPI001953882C|nr:zinc finger CCCH domain-containing protein 13 [Culex pipiens pallens]XP_052567202.1 zinc finger CCCH domain-containing protein 13 [Culex pipiens pallens]